MTQLGFLELHIGMRLVTAAIMFIINLLTLINPVMEKWNGYLLDFLVFIFLSVALLASAYKSVISHKYGDGMWFLRIRAS